MFRPLFSPLYLHLVVLLGLFLYPVKSLGAFTLQVTSGNDTIEQNNLDTFCYYPSVNSSLPLDKGCTGLKADLRGALEAHLSQPPTNSLSVAYYSADLARLGGTDYPIGASRGGKIYLCLSGQTEDDQYRTSCEIADDDNVFGILDSRGRERNTTICNIAIGQRNVSDGCYVPVGLTLEEDSGASTMANGPTAIFIPLILLLVLLLSTSGRLLLSDPPVL